MLARGFTPHSFADITNLKRSEQKQKIKTVIIIIQYTYDLNNKENETEGTNIFLTVTENTVVYSVQHVRIHNSGARQFCSLNFS